MPGFKDSIERVVGMLRTVDCKFDNRDDLKRNLPEDLQGLSDEVLVTLFRFHGICFARLSNKSSLTQSTLGHPFSERAWHDLMLSKAPITNAQEYTAEAREIIHNIFMLLEPDVLFDLWCQYIDIKPEAMFQRYHDLIPKPSTINDLHFSTTEAEALYHEALKSITAGGLQGGWNIVTIDRTVEHWDVLAKIAIQHYPFGIRYINTTDECYNQLCKIAVNENPEAIEFVSSATADYVQLCISAIKKMPQVIDRIKGDVGALIHLAVEQDHNVLSLCKEMMPNAEFKALALKVIDASSRVDRKLLECLKDNADVALAAVTKHPHTIAIFYDASNYPELAKLVVTQDPCSISYIPSNIPGYAALCQSAVKSNGNAIRFVYNDSIKSQIIRDTKASGVRMEYFGTNPESYDPMVVRLYNDDMNLAGQD